MTIVILARFTWSLSRWQNVRRKGIGRRSCTPTCTVAGSKYCQTIRSTRLRLLRLVLTLSTATAIHRHSYYKGGPAGRCCTDLLNEEGCDRPGYQQLLAAFNGTVQAIDIPYLAMSPAQQSAFDGTCTEREAQEYTAAFYFLSFRILAACVVIKLMVGTIISSMQSEADLSAEARGINKSVKMLCAQYRIEQ